MTWYEDLPKIELHVHLEGAIPHKALFELIRKYGGDPSVPNTAALKKRFEYRNFSQFIETWSWKNQFLRNYEDFIYSAMLTARDMAKQNIRYAELFFSPSLFVRHGLEVQYITQSIREGVSQVPGIEIRLIADLVRDYGPESEMRTLKALNEVKNFGIIGIGLGGSEHEYPPAPFEPLFREARKMGFFTNAHAGEAAGPQSVWETIRKLRVQRIGHGTNVYKDPKLMDYIAEKKIPLELCPMSNVRTGAVTSIQEHPIRKYFERGLIISVNTDDPKMFNTSLADEYRMLVEECGFSKKDVCQLILQGIKSSWMWEGRKDYLIYQFQQESSWKSIMGDERI
ncbi:MAG: adenosine deaminase [Candidatus Aminicenantes bacterium]|nr:adenosine deaminase [Candidatus Aminicenantes bacterium]